jgi:hypothetical protein
MQTGACIDTAIARSLSPLIPIARNKRGAVRVFVALALGLAVATVCAAESDTPAPKIGGFYDALIAYTYADPSHWSRAVNRLELDVAGRFGETVKWKLGGRVDADPVYFGSDFYTDRVKRDQRARFFHRENYVDVSVGDWEFRVGAQHIVWGEVVGLYFADVVSARDMREFLLPTFDIMRIPQWAARAEYFSGDSHLELVWIPVPLFDQIGKPGSDFYPAPNLPSPTPQEVADLYRDPVKPGRSLANGNFGLRANTLVGGWDVAGFFYRSFSTSPTFYRVAPDPGQPFAFEPRYDRIWQAGATVSKDFDDFVLRAETVYAHGQGYTLADPSIGDGVVKRNTFDYIVGVDIPLPHDTRLNVQAFQRVFSGGGGDLAVRTDGFGASVLVSSKVTATLEPQLLWIQNFKDGGGLIRPRLNWYPAKNYTVAAGVDIFTGPDAGFFGRFDHRDRAYAELRFDF